MFESCRVYHNLTFKEDCLISGPFLRLDVTDSENDSKNSWNICQGTIIRSYGWVEIIIIKDSVP